MFLTFAKKEGQRVCVLRPADPADAARVVEAGLRLAETRAAPDALDRLIRSIPQFTFAGYLAAEEPVMLDKAGLYLGPMQPGDCVFLESEIHKFEAPD